MAKTLKIGTRGSKLALWQANHIADLLRQQEPGLTVELEVIRTTGDRVQDRPLAEIGGKGLFVKEIEEALLAGTVDLAIHSLKDVPAELPPALFLAAYLKREDPRDAFCTRNGASLSSLPPGAKIGTSSQRRRVQLQRLRPDLVYADLRGNVDTRFRKLDEGVYDGIVLAAAGLNRLGWASRASELLDPEKIIPAIGQGILGLEARRGDEEVLSRLRKLNVADAERSAVCERALLGEMGGSCWLPLGGWSRISGGRIWLTAFLSSIDGKELIRHEAEGTDAEALGRDMARVLLDRGGRKILETIERQHGGK